MLTCQKDKFSLPAEVAYLNCSYMAPLPKRVEMAGYEGVSRKKLPFHILPNDFFDEVTNLRRLFAKLINVADPERIALVPSVSYGMACVARNVNMTAGQNIVVVGEIFPSNYYIWQRLADENGGQLKVVEAPPTQSGRGEAWNERLLEAIDNQTVLVALPNVHWANGTLFDLAAVRKKTHETGALLVIDGTQSVGALPFDVEKLQPDALVCGGYKWLLGPYGLGLAYFGERFDHGIPIEESWTNRLHSENFEALVNYQPAYKPAALRYNMGENSQFIHVPMLAAALEMLLEWGVENIQTYCRRLSQPYLEQFEEMGCRVEDARWRGGHLIGVKLPQGVDWRKLKQKTAAEKVFVSFRSDAMRVSPNVYNEPADFEKLKAVLMVNG